MKTARMTILLTPETKALIQDRAEMLDVSTSELVRVAVENYSSDEFEPQSETEAYLNGLVKELYTAAKEARAVALEYHQTAPRKLVKLPIKKG